jgi:hypothetical protein
VKGLIELIDEMKEKFNDQWPIGDRVKRSERERDSITNTLIDIIKPLIIIFDARIEIDPVIEVVRNEAICQLRMQFAREMAK